MSQTTIQCPHCGQDVLIPDVEVKLCVACKGQMPTDANLCAVCGTRQDRYEEEQRHIEELDDARTERLIYRVRPALFYDAVQYAVIVFFAAVGVGVYIAGLRLSAIVIDKGHGAFSKVLMDNPTYTEVCLLLALAGFVFGPILYFYYCKYSTVFELTNTRTRVIRGLFYPKGYPIDHARVSEVLEMNSWTMMMLGYERIVVSAPDEEEISKIPIYGVPNVREWMKLIQHFRPVQREVQRTVGFQST